jgi:hypothetical protein
LAVFMTLKLLKILRVSRDIEIKGKLYWQIRILASKILHFLYFTHNEANKEFFNRDCNLRQRVRVYLRLKTIHASEIIALWNVQKATKRRYFFAKYKFSINVAIFLRSGRRVLAIRILGLWTCF